MTSDSLKRVDYLHVVNFFAENPLGRELIWNFYCSKYKLLVNDELSLESPALGDMLLLITRTFEDELLFDEVILKIL